MKSRDVDGRAFTRPKNFPFRGNEDAGETAALVKQ